MDFFMNQPEYQQNSVNIRGIRIHIPGRTERRNEQRRPKERADWLTTINAVEEEVHAPSRSNNVHNFRPFLLVLVMQDYS